MKRFAPLFVCLLMLSSCNGVSVAAAYHAADKATYEAIAPEYEAYVQADEKLDAASKASRMRTLATWKMRLEAQQK